MSSYSSKAFNTVDHSILLKKLELYGITDRNHGWVKSYLCNRRQLIQIDEKEKTSLETVSCGVPQGSLLGPLLFLLYLNNFKNTSNILDPIMFANDTNLFFTHQSIRFLFQNANQQSENINQSIISHKLSLNIKKRIINNYEVKRIESIKFFGVSLDENLSWKEDIKYNENEIAKNLGLFYNAKHYLNNNSLLVLYFSFIHTYVN